jgi:hypothetical protein
MTLICASSKIERKRKRNIKHLTPSWNKLLVAHLVKILSAFYEIRRFITKFKISRQLSFPILSKINSVHAFPFCLRYSLILPSHLRLGFLSCLFPSRVSYQNLYPCVKCTRDFGLPSWRNLGLRSSGMLCGLGWYLVADVSEQYTLILITFRSN